MKFFDQIRVSMYALQLFPIYKNKNLETNTT